MNYKYRMHDPRIARFFAVDPLASAFPHNSPYAFSENRVIDGFELEGREVVLINGWYGLGDVRSNENPEQLLEMRKYWNENNPNFEEAALKYFGESEAIYLDGGQGTAGHGSVTVRDNSGYKMAIEMMNSGEIDIHDTDESITLIGHSMGGAYGNGMARAILERAKAEHVDITINFVLLAPDGAEEITVPE